MDAIFNWVCANKLSLNATKTQYMAIQPPTKTFDLSTYTLIIDNVILTQTTSCKFLGMTIDESLSWNKHILNINSKLSRALFVINKSNFICQKTVCIHCTIHYLFLISLIRDFLPGAMQKLAYYVKHKFYKNDLLEPSIIQNSTVIQIHFLSNLVSSRYLT